MGALASWEYLFAAAAYPVLAADGALPPSRLREEPDAAWPVEAPGSRQPGSR